MKPRFSVIIPARDEEKFLPACLDSIKEAAVKISANVEIIVVLNRCSDRTEEIARHYGCLIEKNDQKNLSAIRNTGCLAANGEVLITIDADSKMSLNMLSEIDKCMNDQGLVGGAVLILPERWSMGILVTALMLLPIALRYQISGGVFFCRKTDFLEIGGFDETMCSVEDIDFAKRLKAFGKTSARKFKILLRAHIITSCRKFDQFGDWYMARHPIEFLTLLRGKNQKLADKVWYDFKR